jgi:hypothetical protein
MAQWLSACFGSKWRTTLVPPAKKSAAVADALSCGRGKKCDPRDRRYIDVTDQSRAFIDLSDPGCLSNDLPSDCHTEWKR